MKIAVMIVSNVILNVRYVLQKMYVLSVIVLLF